MKTSIVIATYGDQYWSELALSRAYPSAVDKDAHEVLVGHDEAGTIASVRNELAQKTTGDWLCFLDADDELGSHYLHFMERALKQDRSGADHLLLTPAVSYVLPNGHRQPPRFWPGRSLKDTNFLIIGTLVERDLFMQVGGFNDYPHGFEDWSLWAKCWKEGAEIVKVRRAVYIAHVNNNSKHRIGWRDRRWQQEMHEKVRSELFPEEITS